MDEILNLEQFHSTTINQLVLYTRVAVTPTHLAQSKIIQVELIRSRSTIHAYTDTLYVFMLFFINCPCFRIKTKRKKQVLLNKRVLVFSIVSIQPSSSAISERKREREKKNKNTLTFRRVKMFTTVATTERSRFGRRQRRLIISF